MRRFAYAGLGVALALGGVVTLGVVCRVPLAAALLRYGLGRAGFFDAELVVEQVGLRGVTVAGVRAGDAFRADRIAVAFDFERLPEVPLALVRIDGGAVDLAAWSRRAGGDPEEQEPPPARPFSIGLLPVLELQDFVLTAPSPVGPLRVTLSSRVSPEDGALRMRLDGTLSSDAAEARFEIEALRAPDGRVTIGTQVSSLSIRDPRLAVRGGSASLRVDAQSTGLALDAASGTLDFSLEGVVAGGRMIGALAGSLPVALERDEADSWLARLAAAEIRAPNERLSASGISGVVSEAQIDLSIGRLVESGADRRFEPLSLRVRVAELTPTVRFELDATGAEGRVPIHAEGRYEPTKTAATVALRVPRVELDPRGLHPAHLSPLLAALGAPSGALEVTADLRWRSKTGLTGAAEIVLDHLSLISGGTRIQDLNGRLALSAFTPPATAGLQTVRIGEIHPGVPGVSLSDAVLRFALEPAPEKGSRLRIERFETKIAGGQLLIDDALLDPVALENRLEFRLEAIDLAALFGLVSVEGVSGTGALSGSVPVVMRGRALAIPSGELTAKDGILQIRSAAAADLLAGGGQPVDLLLDALRDFHYEVLVVTIEKGFEGDAAVRLRLEGANPAVLDGHPFRINLNLTGNVNRLVQALLEVAKISDKAVRSTVEAVR